MDVGVCTSQAGAICGSNAAPWCHSIGSTSTVLTALKQCSAAGQRFWVSLSLEQLEHRVGSDLNLRVALGVHVCLGLACTRTVSIIACQL